MECEVGTTTSCFSSRRERSGLTDCGCVDCEFGQADVFAQGRDEAGEGRGADLDVRAYQVQR